MKKSIILSMVIFSAIAQASPGVSLKCESLKNPGVPVLQLKGVVSEKLEVREIFQSQLTGLLNTGAKLKSIGSEGSIFDFALGENYTVDYSVVVDASNKNLEVSLVSYDRDDATSDTEVLNCK